MWNGSLARFPTAAATFRGGTDGHRRLRDHDQLTRHVRSDGVGDSQHMAQVRRAILVRRSSDRDEDDFGSRDRRADVRGEHETTLLLIPFDQAVEARFVNGQDVLLQPIDLFLIDVRADHLISGLRQASANDEADIAGPDDSNLHSRSSSLKLRGRNSLSRRLGGGNRVSRRAPLERPRVEVRTI